jgi:hypothetical protein
MKRKFILIGVALGTFCVGLVVTRTLVLSTESPSSAAIPAIQLQDRASCVEAQTSAELSTFFSAFRDALKSNDTHRLFTMTRRCNFDWYADLALSPAPISRTIRPFPLEPPFEVSPYLRVPWGQSLVFESENDFALNSQVIFAPRVRRHLLLDDPRPSTECEYAVNWRERVLNHLCFERDSSGFKFIGLRIEP